jgi:hypothetical protein
VVGCCVLERESTLVLVCVVLKCEATLATVQIGEGFFFLLLFLLTLQ